MPERKPIFYDQERRRWRRTRRVLEITGGFFTLVLVIFLVNVFRKPELPDILQAATHWGYTAVPTRVKSKIPPRGRKRKIAALGKIRRITTRYAPRFTLATIPPASLR